MPTYYVSILANRTGGAVYVGVTSNSEGRIYQHKHKLVAGYTMRYNITRLVYYEDTSDISAAIAREKQIKAWRRSKKVALIQSVNPHWVDLSREWSEDKPPRAPQNAR